MILIYSAFCFSALFSDQQLSHSFESRIAFPRLNPIWSSAMSSVDALTNRNLIEKTSEMAAKLAGKIILESKINLSEDVTSKIGSRDIVTEVDKKAQEKIKQTIISKFPNHTFLGEEDVLPGKNI